MTANSRNVLELRQYTLRPGQRERLVGLFEREFIEPQEALGISLPGQFRDLDDPDRFVWLRGFDDMQARAQALAAFYDGPVWRAHREEANATMLDSDDVLLLQPLQDFTLDGLTRPAPGERLAAGLIAATICPIAPGDAVAWARTFETQVQARLHQHGAQVLAHCVTEPARNSFPRLPVREGEFVFIWFAAFADSAAHAACEAACVSDPLFKAWIDRLEAAPETLRLSPTPRSLLRGGSSPTGPAPATKEHA